MFRPVVPLLWRWLPLLVLGFSLLAACGRSAEPTSPMSVASPTVASAVPSPPEEAAAQETKSSACSGAWVEQVVFVEDPDRAGIVARLEAGEYDVYAYSLADPVLWKKVQDRGFRTVQFYGSSRALSLNPAGPIFEGTGKLNPFAVPRIREALNWLVDREYIVQEILGGLGVPKFTPLYTAMPDYARYIDLIRPLEARYRYDLEKARTVIAEEMGKLGAEMKEGVWHFEGEPVTLIFVIRTEDERKEIGDYVARQLEAVGFQVERQYKTSKEARTVVNGDPHAGLWHLYTAGHLRTFVERDQGYLFEYYYTPRGRSAPLWQAYQPAAEFDEVARRLSQKDYRTPEERRELFARALELALKDSVRVWLVDKAAFSPMQPDVQVAYDLAGGVAGSRLWPWTLRRTQPGGSVTVAQPSLLTGPWNPLAGSSMVYDLMPLRGTVDWGAVPDPYTGLALPMRVEKAQVTVLQGTPIEHTLDWVTLEYAEEIPVPEDAWAIWDPTAGRFLTVKEVAPEGRIARARIRVTYPVDLFQKVRWHDGSPLSPGDFLMAMILQMDVTHPDSPHYDPGLAARWSRYLERLKGVRVLSWEPLVIETYTDSLWSDAELLVAFEGTWFPTYRLGPVPWHVMAVALRAVGEGELAFSRATADEKNVEWLSLMDGPSLEVLRKHLNRAASEAALPYAQVLGEYVSPEEVQTRWANLQAWVEARGHFWVGTGPFYLDQVLGVEGGLVLRCFPQYAGDRERWTAFAEPPLPQVRVEGPSRVSPDETARFRVVVDTPEGEPYPAQDIDGVRFLLFDEAFQVVAQGTAAADAGDYEILLEPAIWEGREPGFYRLEVVVLSKRVSKPALAVHTLAVK